MPARVLYLHHVGALSGAEGSLRLLLRHLDRARVAPLFAGPARGVFPAALAADGVPMLPLAFAPLRRVDGVLGAVARLVRLVRAHRVDLLHANGPQTNVPAGLAGRLTGVPVIWHARNLLTDGMWDVDRALAPLATRIICNADAIRRRFAGSRGWDRSVTIVNAVDTREFHPSVPRAPFRQELGVPDVSPLVGLVGRIGLGKGHEHFVEAAVRLLRGGADAHFAIVGDPLFDEDAWRTDALRRTVKDAGVEDRIRFVGYRRDIPQVMRGLDVLVLASDAEPCGRVLFEAMASGTAVVATNSGGTPEIVRDGVEGVLVPPRDPAALARAVGALVADAPRRARLGAAGVARVAAEFTVERYVARTLAIYDEALAGGYFDKRVPGGGGGVAGALVSLELAGRTATLGLAARLTGSSPLAARAEASAACRADVAAAPRARVPTATALALVAALLLAAYAGTVIRIAADSGFIDFAHYYAYAIHVARGGDPYDPSASARLNEALGLRSAGAPLKYLPLFYVAMRPWTWLPFRASALAWLALGQVLLVATAALVLRHRAAEPTRLVAILAIVALFQPLVETLYLGQTNVVLLFLLALGWWGARHERPWGAAFALGLAAHVKPQFGLPIAALWWIGQRAVAYRAAAVAAGGLAAGVAVVGPAAHVDWARLTLAMPAYLHAWSLNVTPHAALHRLLDGALGARAVEPLALAASLTILAVLAYAVRGRPAPGTPAFDWAFGLAVAAVPLVAPIAEEHHLVVLLLPLALLVLAPDASPRASAALVVTAVLLGARYSFERFPALHAGVPSLLLTGKTVGVGLLAWLLARRLREMTR